MLTFDMWEMPVFFLSKILKRLLAIALFVAIVPVLVSIVASIVSDFSSSMIVLISMPVSACDSLDLTSLFFRVVVSSYTLFWILISSEWPLLTNVVCLCDCLLMVTASLLQNRTDVMQP